MNSRSVKVNLEFPKDKFSINNSIVARGQFMISYMLGSLDGKTVSIKSVNEYEHYNYFKALVSELKVMRRLKHHPHILNLMGYCTSNLMKREIILAFECCSKGNLLKLLRNGRSYFQQNSTSSHFIGCDRIGQTAIVENLSFWHLLMWSHEIVTAMEFLAYNKVVHGDLSARNVLITSDFKTKLCNFCFSKRLTTSSTYTHNYPHITLPLKWMAPESIRQLTFSIQSDVWSFGVLLWEIFSLGEGPYAYYEVNSESWRYLIDGQRLEKPLHSTDELYRVMLHCWEIYPVSRPSFSVIRHSIESEMRDKKRSTT